MTIKILLQTTIVTSRDDWAIARFELLANCLRLQKDGFGTPLFAVTARDREPLEAVDPVLSTRDVARSHSSCFRASVRPEYCHMARRRPRAMNGKVSPRSFLVTVLSR
jgi:hypothetical protein